MWLSHVSLWEITLKHTLARADMPLSAAQATQWAQAIREELTPLSSDGAFQAYGCLLRDDARD